MKTQATFRQLILSRLHLQRSLDGDKNPRWKGWYDPAKRRPNNGFPTHEMLEEIRKKITENV
jgi:hypothetical protein